jgi:hypothetical protein
MPMPSHTADPVGLRRALGLFRAHPTRNGGVTVNWTLGVTRWNTRRKAVPVSAGSSYNAGVGGWLTEISSSIPRTSRSRSPSYQASRHRGPRRLVSARNAVPHDLC